MNQFQDQNCDGYTRTALMGNWYEDREAINQPFNTDRDFRQKRQEDQECIVYPTINGQLKNLPKVQRAHPWLTKDVIIPNDGFREFRSVTQTQYDITNIDNMKNIKHMNACTKQLKDKNNFPESNRFNLNVIFLSQVVPHKVEKTLNANNLHEITLVQRPVVCNSFQLEKRTDYDSTFSKHNKEHDRFYAMTTYHQFFERQNKDNIQDVNNYNEKKVISIISVLEISTETLTNKVLNKLRFLLVNNTESSKIQKIMYLSKELGFTRMISQFINLGSTKRLKKLTVSLRIKSNQRIERQSYVNLQSQYQLVTLTRYWNKFTSKRYFFNLEGYDHLRQKYYKDGEYRHIRTDITMIHNKPICAKR